MEEDKEILKYYKFMYVCGCGRKYGSDKKESPPHMCPICEEKNKK